MTRWFIRDAETGRLPDDYADRRYVDSGDIDYALSVARRRFGHNVTVDNLTPRPDER